MAVEVIVPVLGETMDEGTIVEWLVDVGQPVVKGEPICQIETDKAVLQVEAPANGVLRKIFYDAGSKVAVLTVVGLIADPDEDVDTYQGQQPPGVPAMEKGIRSEPAASAPPSVSAPTRVFASPRARKLAARHDVDLSEVTASGPGGRILERDVDAFLQQRAAAERVAPRSAKRAGPDLSAAEAREASAQATSAGIATVPLSGIRAVIAQRMSESALTTARVTLTTEADATELVRLRSTLTEKLEPELGHAVSYTDLLVAMVARALCEHPYMNSRFAGDHVQQLAEVHIGVAVDTERGLMVPVVRDADQKGIADLARTLRDLASRARNKAITPDELTGSTFTITNLGMYDIDAFTPLINLPECAILGIGRLCERPAVWRGDICVRATMVMSLTFDHRLVDGAPAARFLRRIKQLVEQPYLMLT